MWNRIRSSPSLKKVKCKKMGFSNYSCNCDVGIQNPMQAGESTGVLLLTVMVSGWDSCLSLSQCTVTTAMGNHFVWLDFNSLLVNSSLKYQQEWQYLSMSELWWDEGEWLNIWLTENDSILPQKCIKLNGVDKWPVHTSCQFLWWTTQLRHGGERKGKGDVRMRTVSESISFF